MVLCGQRRQLLFFRGVVMATKNLAFTRVSKWAVGRSSDHSRVAIKLNEHLMALTLADAAAIGTALLSEAKELDRLANKSPISKAS
jgi:hypothetical protein